MRIARFLLLALALSAPAAGARRARQPELPQGPIRAQLEVTVNGIRAGLVDVELETPADAWVPVAVLREVGVERFGGTRRLLGEVEVVSLRSLEPGVRFELDEVALALRITAAPELWRTTRLSMAAMARPAGLEFRADPSGFLNYALHLRDFQSLAANAELGFSVAGALAFTGLSASTDGQLVRGSSYLLYDEREALRRWQLGDAVATTGLLGGTLPLGGLSLRREFSLDPYQVRAALPRTTGYADSPSTVEVYVNGALVRRDALPPGPFELSELPLQTGAGTYDTVVRDAFGRVQQLGAAYYYSSGLMAPGLTDYEYSLGFERLAPASESFRYERPVFLGRHRAGVTDWLTAGARLEGGLDRLSGGVHGTVASPLGELELALAGSRHGAHAGAAGSLAWSYSARTVSGGVLGRVQSARYAHAALGAEQDRALAEGRAFVAVPLFGVASLGAEYGMGWLRDAGVSDRLALRAQAGLFRGAHLTVSAGRATVRGETQYDVFALVNYSFDALTVASAGGALSGTGPSASVSVQKSVPAYAEGFGYRLHADAVRTSARGGAQLDYQASFGRFQTTMDWANGRSTLNASAAGGVVLMDGRLFWTRPVSSAYALLKVGEVAGVRGYLNNQLVGTTDDQGSLLIPDLLAYHGNRLRVDDADIPLTYAIEGGERTIAPPHRGGALVRFDLDALEAIAGTVVIDEGGRRSTPSYGELRFADTPNPLGRRGEFYVEGVRAGTHLMELRHKGRSCPVVVIVPEGKAGADPVLDVGEVVCRLGTVATAAAATPEAGGAPASPTSTAVAKSPTDTVAASGAASPGTTTAVAAGPAPSTTVVARGATSPITSAPEAVPPATLVTRGDAAPTTAGEIPPATRIAPVSLPSPGQATREPSRPNTDVVAPGAAAEVDRQGLQFRVPAGTCLWRIARRVYGKGARWGEIADANPGVVRDHDQMIREGAELWIPCEPTDPGCHPDAF